jgi:ABC-type nitrate/sulfonate/bicarbonate transport system substrate-binding protein
LVSTVEKVHDIELPFSSKQPEAPNMKQFNIAVALVIATAIPANLAAQMKTRIAWTSFASNMAGTWVAQEEGLFKKNGVETELVHIPSTSRAIQTMLAGEIAFRDCVYLHGWP